MTDYLASENAALRARIAELEETLKPFRMFITSFRRRYPRAASSVAVDTAAYNPDAELTIGDFDRLAAALAKGDKA